MTDIDKDEVDTQQQSDRRSNKGKEPERVPTPDEGEQTQDRMSFEEMVAELEKETPEDYLMAKMPSDTYTSLERMYPYYGLSSVKELRDILEGNDPNFQPFFEEYWTNGIQPRKKAGGNRGNQGPRFDTITTIMDLERFRGSGKYVVSARPVDRSKWTEEDHAAFCLTQLVYANHNLREGLFWRRGMSVDAVQIRLWQLVLRASMDRTRGEKRKLASVDEKNARLWGSEYGEEGTGSTVSESLSSQRETKKPRLDHRDSVNSPTFGSEKLDAREDQITGTYILREIGA